MSICSYMEVIMEKNIDLDELLLRLSEFYKVLSDYTRVRIVYNLLGGEMCVGDIEKKIGMSQTAVSHQLKLLRQAHLVKYYRKGQNVYYVIDDEHVRNIINVTSEHLSHK